MLVETWNELRAVLERDDLAVARVRLARDLYADANPIVAAVPNVSLHGGGHKIHLFRLGGGEPHNCLWFVGAHRVLVRDLTLRGAPDLLGTVLKVTGDGDWSSGVELRRCRFERAPDAGGFLAARVGNASLLGCQFDDVGTGHPWSEEQQRETNPHAAYLTSGNVRIRRCAFDGSGHYALVIRNYHTAYPTRYPVPVREVTVTHCRFTGCDSGMSITCGRPDGAVRVMRNHFGVCQRATIMVHRDMVGAKDVTIAHNYYVDGARFGVINMAGGDLEWWREQGFDQ